MKSAVLRFVANGQPDKSHDVVLVPLHDEVVTEEDEHVDLAFRDHSADLEVSAQRAAQQADHRRRFGTEQFGERGVHQPSGRAGTVQVTMLEGPGIIQ